MRYKKALNRAFLRFHPPITHRERYNLDRFTRVIVTLLFCLTAAEGQSTTGAFAEGGVGPRAQGLGGAFVAIADDAYAMSANPAGLANMDRASVTFEYSDLFGLGLAKQSYFGAVFPTKWGTHGLYYRGLRFAFDPFPETLSEVTLGYSYGRAWGPIAIGTTLKYFSLTSDFDQGTASGFGLDLGARYQATTRWSLGASIQNIYSSLAYATGTDESIPTTWRLGASYRISDRWLASAEYDGVSDDPFAGFRAGTEYWIMRPGVKKVTQAAASPEQRSIFEKEKIAVSYPISFAVRTGFEKQQSGASSFLPSVGTTLGYGSVRLDYAYIWGSNTLGSTHRYALTYDFRPWGMDEPEEQPVRTPTRPAEPVRSSTPVSQARVAVLDFANGTGSADLDWLQAGFADILARQLRTEGVDLVGRQKLVGSATMAGPDFLALARREGAAYVVRGLFVRSGPNQTVLNARLIDASTGATIDHVEVEGPEDQIFSLGNSLAAKIAAITRARIR